MTALLLVLAIVGSLVLAAFCAGAETAFLSVRRGRVLHMARAGGARAKIIQEALSNIGRTTSALLVGNNLASVAYSSASAALSVAAFPESSSAQSVWSVMAAVVVSASASLRRSCSARRVPSVVFWRLRRRGVSSRRCSRRSGLLSRG